MESGERREERRLSRQFPAMLQCCVGSDILIEGMSENLSQHGAFIKTKNWNYCQAHEQTVVTFFLPPDFTGQDNTIGLQGTAIITRVDQENQGVGLRFVKNFKQFDQIALPPTSERTGYRNLAYYILKFAKMSSAEFTATYPNGFLVETSHRFFDKDTILQFTTEISEDSDKETLFKSNEMQVETERARVIELGNKDRADTTKTTIGRSPANDIIFLNETVSRRHAYLILASTDRSCYLTDRNSANGTFVNGNRIPSDERYLVADGDEICFGPQTKVIYFSSHAFHRFLMKLAAKMPLPGDAANSDEAIQQKH